MPVNTVEPRLPLEPEEYPLYKPPSRLGCSAITIVTLLTLAVFAFLFWRVTPDIAKGITDVPRKLFPTTPKPDTTPGSGAMATTTALKPPTPVPATAAVVVAATPTPQYVKVANTGGRGVRIRQQPTQNASYNNAAEDGELFTIIGPDTVDQYDKSRTWRNVQRVSDGEKGWILSQFLVPASGPKP